MSIDIRDFTVGQTVWIELKNNRARGLTGEELIEEWEVAKVGKKYVYAKKKSSFSYEYSFYSSDKNYLIENTNYTPDYYLYKTKEEIENELDKREKAKIIREYLRLDILKLDYEKICKIYEIIKE